MFEEPLYDDIERMRERCDRMERQTQLAIAQVGELTKLTGKTLALLRKCDRQADELRRENALLKRRLEAMGRQSAN
jgi:hypothetical protein